ALVLATGHVAALVWRGGWPHYRAADVPGILLRWGAQPTDPGRAWDAVNRGVGPPGPVAWWVTFLGVAAIPAAGAVLAERRTSGRRRAKGATWASARQLGALTVRRRSGRLVLGRGHRRLVAAESRHSVLVLGPTQSGKTTGLVVPAILEWQGPVVAT